MQKKKLYILILILIFGMQNYAQNEKISIGVKFLPGMSILIHETLEKLWSPQLGGGFVFVTNFTDIVGIETGLNYTYYNLTSAYIIYGPDNSKYVYRTENSISYLSIPVLVRLNFSSFYFSIGATINGLLSSLEKTNGVSVQFLNDSIYNNQYSMPGYEDLKPIVIESNLHFGYQFNINNKFGINLEGRFSYTLSSLYSSGDPVRKMGLGLGIGFCYFIKPKQEKNNY